ncbi:hypothetical protein [Mycolicibacterium fortuitum]|uniref:hypothetical protein n=1 Tax=Mycolicibacterium fortuitum TaxID=1766 RepID=UPI001CE0C7AD|nr:hypothetical protein [Mycolicibacterium fortuitum]MCA4722165.1 hypothetical protein [Mycolicibacterium fortuitum]
MIVFDNEVVRQDPTGLMDGSFDLIIVGASWDRRCRTLIASTDLVTHSAVLIRYANTGVSGSSDASLEFLNSFVSPRTKNSVEILALDSAAMVDTWTEIRKAVVQTCGDLRRPMHIAVDLSSVPRYISMGLLGFGYKSGCAAQMTFWYSAAKDYRVLSDVAKSTGSSQFTVGSWLPQPIPVLSRPTSGSAPMHLLVSTGLEGSLTLGLVDDLEPARVQLVYSTGNDSSLTNRVHRENAVLEDAYLIEDGDRVDWPLFDACGLAAEIVKGMDEKHFDQHGRLLEHSLLMCGPKTHALAFAVAACQSDVKNVFFGLAENRREVTGDPVGPFYRCDLRMPLVG